MGMFVIFASGRGDLLISDKNYWSSGES